MRVSFGRGRINAQIARIVSTVCEQLLRKLLAAHTRSRLQARAREAEERSRKILEEEKSKDAAWGEAVKIVCFLGLF